MELDSSARRLPGPAADQEVTPLALPGVPGRDQAPSEPAPLSVAGRSEDGRRLLLVDADGTEYQLLLDHRVRAAVTEQTARTSLETPMESVLRPRDIQARIRAGETPEAVAETARTSVDRIMPFAGPVLAEREHVAERAQRSSLRRRPGATGESAAPRVLGDAVAAHLRGLQVSPETVTWDAWRREDGRWTLTATFASSARSGTARFGFDLPGNFVLAEDDDARWLVGELVEEPPAPRDDLQDARQRRQSVVPPPQDEQLPLGEDALDLVHEADSHPLEGLLDEPAPAAAPVPAEEPVAEQTLAEQPLAEQPVAEAPVAEAPVAEAPVEEAPAPRRPAKNRRGRASVPSWDEIMFGGGKQE